MILATGLLSYCWPSYFIWIYNELPQYSLLNAEQSFGTPNGILLGAPQRFIILNCIYVLTYNMLHACSP